MTASLLWLDPAYGERSCRDADPGLFVQADGERLESVQRWMTPVALMFCAGCPVRAVCRERGERESWGLWGGVVRWRQGNGRLAGVDLLE